MVWVEEGAIMHGVQTLLILGYLKLFMALHNAMGLGFNIEFHIFIETSRSMDLIALITVPLYLCLRIVYW